MGLTFELCKRLMLLTVNRVGWEDGALDSVMKGERGSLWTGLCWAGQTDSSSRWCARGVNLKQRKNETGNMSIVTHAVEGNRHT